MACMFLSGLTAWDPNPKMTHAQLRNTLDLETALEKGDAIQLFLGSSRFYKHPDPHWPHVFLTPFLCILCAGKTTVPNSSLNSCICFFFWIDNFSGKYKFQDTRLDEPKGVKANMFFSSHRERRATSRVLASAAIAAGLRPLG